jgi:hypothetical protein
MQARFATATARIRDTGRRLPDLSVSQTDKCPLAASYPPSQRQRGWGTHGVGEASEIKSLSHPRTGVGWVSKFQGWATRPWSR